MIPKEDIETREVLLDLYKEALIRYKDSLKPSNYIVPFVRRRVDFRLIEERYNANFDQILFCTINDIFKKPVCLKCGSDVRFIGFGQGYSRFCSSKCSHTTDEYRENYSKKRKGRPSPLKGKSYLEIHGTSTPKCGFRKGRDNPNFNPILKARANESLRNYYKKNPQILEKKRQLIYSRDEYFINSGKLKFENSRGEKFRSNLEVQFSEFLIENDFSYKYEVPCRLINGKMKIVDFIVDDFLFVEISGYAYEAWRKDFDTKMRLLRQSTDSPILILTYPNLVFQLRERNFIGRDIYFGSIDDVNYILRGILFYRSILTFNQKVCIE